MASGPQVDSLFTNCRANQARPTRAAGEPATSLIGRIPLTEWPFRLCNIEARIEYPEHFAQHRELTGTHASGLGCI
jgi:hypothetical protein